MKIKYYIFLGINFLTFLPSMGQDKLNLIPNGNFEKFEKKIRKIKHKGNQISDNTLEFKNLKKWFNPNGTQNIATPDLYYRKNSKTTLVHTVYGDFTPLQNSAIGIMVFNGQNYTRLNYREYFSVKLKRQLVEGNEYELEFYITNGQSDKNSKHTYGKYCISKLGILFSKERPRVFDGRSSLKMDQQPQLEIEECIYTSSWQVIKLKFIADGNHKYFTIGNFNDDYQYYDSKGKDSNGYKIENVGEDYAKGNHAYYFFDNFSLKKLTDDSDDYLAAKDFDKKLDDLPFFEREIQKNLNSNLSVFKDANQLNNCEDNLILSNLLFVKDEPIFREDIVTKAYEELDKVANFLIENPNRIVLISGHTVYVKPSNLNPNTYNYMHTLSKRRAKAAKKYLMDEKGIDDNRIITIGYGCSKPIIKNEKAPENRRIEIKVICDTSLDEEMEVDESLDHLEYEGERTEETESEEMRIPLNEDNFLEKGVGRLIEDDSAVGTEKFYKDVSQTILVSNNDPGLIFQENNSTSNISKPLIIKPKNGNLEVEIGQKIRFNYNKDLWKQPKITNKIFEIKAGAQITLDIEDIVYQCVIKECEDGDIYRDNWYKVSFFIGDQKIQGWVLGLDYSNLNLYCN